MNNFKHKNKEWLYEQYIILDRTGADIARECGINKESLYEWLEKFDFKKPKQGIKLPATIDGKYNPAYYKLYYQKNRERINCKNKAYIKKTKYTGLRTLDYREMAVNLLLERDGNICAVCNEHFNKEDCQIDHIKQRAKGGTHEASNLRLLHKSCNTSRPKWNKRVKDDAKKEEK